MSRMIANLSPSQPANPQLGAEIALLLQLWETTIHSTLGLFKKVENKLGQS